MSKDILKEMDKIEVKASAQDLWEPAQPGETLENVWIPNRRQRRKMLNAKGKKRGMRQMGKILQATEDYAKTNPDFKKELYKALYENLKVKAADVEEQFKKEQENNEGTTEGN